MTDNSLLLLESRLRQLTLEVNSLIENSHASRHLGGFVTRFYMMQTSRMFLEGKFESGRHAPMSAYETTDCMIHINGYYMNLRGSIDNLSWMLQYKKQVLANLDESAGRKRQGCYIFSKDFKKNLLIIDSKLANGLLRYEQWAKDFSELRDPAAHRIPIVIGRSVLVTEDAKKIFESIISSLPVHLAAGKSLTEIYAEADSLGKRLPIIFLQHMDGKIEPRPLLFQLRHDHSMYIEIATEVLKSFIEEPAAS